MHKSATQHGAQIDMLLDRADDVISVLEMKFTRSPFEITEGYYNNLVNKLSRLEQAIGHSKTLQLTIVSATGIKENQYTDLVQNTIDLDSLFI